MYLLDTNVFIEAKNRYYGLDFCPGFWEWLDLSMGSGRVASIDRVYDELNKGSDEEKKDELAKWVQPRKKRFLQVNDFSTQRHYKSIISNINNNIYLQRAVNDFLYGADPWLIAKALTMGATVVTHEKDTTPKPGRILIPNICKEFNVPYVNTFDVLRDKSNSFTLVMDDLSRQKLHLSAI